MKKTLMGILVILGVGAMAIFATQAYFSSNQTIPENTITSGSIDLTLNGQDQHESLNLENLKPGDIVTYSYLLKNTGTLAAQPSIIFGEVINNDNGCTEPEDGKDNSCDIEGSGELGNNLQIKAEWQQDGSYKLIRLKDTNGAAKLNVVSGATVGLGLLTGGGTDNALPVLNGGDEVEVKFTFNLPASTNNIVQTDSSIVDITFDLKQI